ncbi:methionine ABC transporter substrate-binding protein [Cohnella kolymensis]|uniref:Lipoprotein n=1 Tax=Cohnella kolymensis TaxID=1590652 RepID=A0ABR5A4T0_9BACL|nr:MetQ/NlpA family ABC transporter substrate-binding protein [Cohnella kolymensis]KIL36005.1 methionine ABC transporter substrate-binding protein [Cohnella kolymensis]
MKKILFLSLTIVLAFTLSACGQKPENTSPDSASASASNEAGSTASSEPVTLKVGATAVPQAEILEHIVPALKAEGVNLEIKEFTDYVQPNVQVYEKQLDANFFQHIPYMEQFNKDRNMDLVKVTGVHIEPFGAYSSKIKKTDELKDGASVAIPNDPSNGGRALALLEKNGLIKLKAGVGISGTVKDITENPKNLKLKELEAAMLPRALDEVDLALINTNYAIEAGLNPMKDALFIEDKESPYVNILTARPDNAQSDAMQKLAKALNSEDVKQFINDKYKGAVVPAF